MPNAIAHLLLLIYIAAFVRQYLWPVGNNTLAWVLTILISGVIWYFLFARQAVRARVTKRFWFVVALPLFVIYVMRVAFPDGSFDQLNYHLLNGERALRGVPFTSADFFPAPFQFNPAPEMVHGMVRYVLGYRLGTIVNYLVLVWCAGILYRLLRTYVTNEWFLCFAVLLIVLTEQPLFEINNYMVDLLAVPLLLEATDRADLKGDLTRIGFFLGASLAFKLTNVVVVLPLMLVYAWRWRPRIKQVALFLVALIAPLVPFTIFMYRQTGSPVFPFYNKIFRSPFWPLINWTDPRWGPKSIWEGIVWPILVTFKPERSSELAVYSGRLSLVFVVVIAGLILRPSARTRTLCVIVIIGIALWTLSTGYVRYATYLELLGGATVVALCWELRRFKREAIVFVCAILAVQAFIACKYVYALEWSMRPTFFHNPDGFVSESGNILRDHSFTKFLPERERRLFQNVDVWVESNFITNGLETLANKDAPMILVCFPYYFETQPGLDRFAKALDDAANKRMYTLVFKKDISPSLDMLSFRGLEMGKFTAVTVPFYSPNNRFDMVLIEIRPPGKGVRRELIKATPAAGPMPAGAFRAQLTVADTPTTLTAGGPTTIYVTMKNTGDSTWPALGRADGAFATKLGNHWYNEQNVMVVQDDARTSLLFDVQPGQEMELPITVTAPREPGRYTLEIDMVQELVNWFGPSGSKTLRLPVVVQAKR